MTRRGQMFLLGTIGLFSSSCRDDSVSMQDLSMVLDQGTENVDQRVEGERGSIDDRATIHTDVFPSLPDSTLMNFGEACPPKKDCRGNLKCVEIGDTSSAGFCSMKCEEFDAECTPVPAGSKAFCIVQDDPTGDFYCGFICERPGETYSCPATLTCSATDNPPDSGQRICVPAETK